MSNIDLYSTPGQRFRLELAGSTWELERHADLESLWEAMGQDQHAAAQFEDDERLPYWTELWPSAIMLSRWLCRNAGDIARKHCLDLGCGLGLTTLAGASCGAHVLGVDYEWPAVHFAGRNTRLNRDKLQTPPLWVQMDWRAPALRRGVFSRIWAADVMYERRFIQPLSDVLRHALAPGGRAWIAEPGRVVFHNFVGRMFELGWRCEKICQEKTPQVTVPGPPATVNVWELTRTT